MLLPIGSNNLSLIPMFFNVVCDYPPAAVISGYGEYANQMDTDQRAIMQKTAQKIVDSLNTNTPIVVVAVVGYADTALKEPVGTRTAKEMDVSVKRAQAATDDLKRMIEDLSRGKVKDPLKIVKFAAPAGVGATKKLVSNAWNESLMKMNRRVEIYFGQCTVPPEWTWRDAAQRGQVLLKDGSTDARKRVLCMLGKILTISDVSDGYFDYKNFKDLFFPPGMSEDAKAKLLSSAVTHLIKQLGTRANFGTATEVADDQFIKNLEAIDEVITRSMRDFKANAEQAGVGASVLVMRAWTTINASRTDAKSIYSCYASYTW